jgi:predicted transcriptional regulator
VKEHQTLYRVRKERSRVIDTPKQTALRVVKRMKADASFEEIMYELYFLQKVEQGLKDIEEGGVVSHEEVRKSLRKWLK